MSSRPHSLRFTGSSASRQAEIAVGIRLQRWTLGYNVLEAVVALTAGFASRSIALIGFGVDSLIESWSALTMIWRLRKDRDLTRRISAEMRAQRMIGLSFFALSAYVAGASSFMLLYRHGPEASMPGLVLATSSVLVMPLLARAKSRVAWAIGSASMLSDARQTVLSCYLSGTLLAGLALKARFGWWWADPAAALLMCPVILREGLLAWRGRSFR